MYISHIYIIYIHIISYIYIISYTFIYIYISYTYIYIYISYIYMTLEIWCSQIDINRKFILSAPRWFVGQNVPSSDDWSAKGLSPIDPWIPWIPWLVHFAEQQRMRKKTVRSLGGSPRGKWWFMGFWGAPFLDKLKRTRPGKRLQFAIENGHL